MEIHRLPPVVYASDRFTVSEALRVGDQVTVTIIDKETDAVRTITDTAKGIINRIPGDPFQQKVLKSRLEKL